MPVEISIPLEDARRICELYRACALADIHYHSCQGALFRRYVCETYKAPGISRAFERLKARLDEQETGKEE